MWASSLTWFMSQSFRTENGEVSAKAEKFVLEFYETLHKFPCSNECSREVRDDD